MYRGWIGVYMEFVFLYLNYVGMRKYFVGYGKKNLDINVVKKIFYL